MSKLGILIIFLFSSIFVNAQKNQAKFDVRFGVGTSILGTGDMQTVLFENELNIKLNSYFSFGGGLVYGQSFKGVFEQTTLIQVNANMFISPFKNDKSNDFRIGSGLTWYKISDVFRSGAYYEGSQLIEYRYDINKRSSLGINLILEDTYAISEKFSLGLKLFAQAYFNGDSNSGLALKFGIHF